MKDHDDYATMDRVDILYGNSCVPVKSMFDTVTLHVPPKFRTGNIVEVTSDINGKVIGRTIEQKK